MADNVETNPGSLGAVFATDDIAGIHHTRVKVEYGDDGSATDVSLTNPMPVLNQAGDNAIGRVKITDGTDVALVSAGGALLTDASATTQPVSLSATTNAGVAAKTSDYDTGAGTDTVTMVGLALPASGGSVQGGTATNPVRTDTTGTTTQPVSAASLPLPSGASTEATLSTLNTKIPAQGQALMAASVPVVLASNQSTVAISGSVTASGTVTANAGTGPWPITDNAGSITVDNAGTFATQAAQSGTWTVQPGNTANTTAWKVDASSVAVPITDNSGSLTVDNAGTFAVQDSQAITDNAAFTDGTSKLFMTGYIYDEVAGTALAENDAAAARINVNRATVGVIEDGATRARYATVTAANAVKVDGSAVTQPVSGTFWQATQPISGSVNATLDAETTKVIGTINVAAAQTIAVTSATAANTKVEPAGNVAHDAADSGNPIKIGAKAVSSTEAVTLVASGDRTDLAADLDGVLVTKIGATNADLVSERVADTSGTSTAFTNFGAVASTRNYITSVHVYNSSATDGYVDFRDGAAGAVLFTAAAPAGGGMTLACPTPLFKTTANTALAYDVSGALTTVYVNVSGYQSKA